VVYDFPYRGTTEEWSQRYHVDADFSSVGDFHSCFDAFVTAVKAMLYPEVRILRGYGYHNTDNDSFDTYVLGAPVAGTLSASTGFYAPGDSAMWIRWNTERRNSRGRLIYLRKYFHGVQISGTAGEQDNVLANQLAAANTFGTNATGTGWSGKHLAGPDGLVPGGGRLAGPKITTRTLKRR
jgi:hypothetical protein